MNTFALTSPAFENGGAIPKKYTCDGEGISPPLAINDTPEGTKSLVLIVGDPDIPNVFKESRGIEAFDHWVLFNIPPETREVPEGATTGTTGLNSAGEIEYAAPCPPPQYEPKEHRYIFLLYALSGALIFAETPTAGQVREALAPLLLTETKLIGCYSRA
jgi:Raf kinase inhibitor-like YbhB/YbcL family protein